jgi:hypothetical protein
MVAKTEVFLKDFKRVQKHLSREDFAKQNNHPFLVFDMEHTEDQSSRHSFDTKRVQSDHLASLMKQSLLRTVSSKVIKLVKKGTNLFRGYVNVGRTPNCDIVINNPAISKFHAYFAKDIKDGSYYIIDADSTNGTYVNDVKVEPNARKPLHDGDKISFGHQINLSFYTPEGCYDLLKQIPD